MSLVVIENVWLVFTNEEVAKMNASHFVVFCLLLVGTTLYGQPDDFVWPQPGVPADIEPQLHIGPTVPVKEAVQKLLEKPNDAQSHWELAKALFRRGAGNDIIRFWRHASRACQLNSSLLREVEQFTAAEEVVFRRLKKPTEELLEADDTIAVPLSPRKLRFSKTSKMLVERLGKRFSSAPKQRGFSVSSCRNLVKKLFDWHGTTGGMKWQQRIRALEGKCFEHEGTRRIGQVLTEDILPEIRDRVIREDIRLRARKETTTGKSLGAFVLDAKIKVLSSLFNEDITGCVNHLIDLVAKFDSAAAMSMNASPYERAHANRGRHMGLSFLRRQGIPGNFRDTYRGGLETLEALASPEVSPEFAVGQIVDFVVSSHPVVVGSPLLIDLNGNSAPNVLTSLIPDGKFEEANSVSFDLNGDGIVEEIEWIEPEADGLLAVDLDNDGLITSGLELFGTAHGDTDGFYRLATFDIDGNGWVEGAEALGLLIWLDDGDGVCQKSEVTPISKHGIVAISCRPENNCSQVRLTKGQTRCWDWWPDCH